MRQYDSVLSRLVQLIHIKDGGLGAEPFAAGILAKCPYSYHLLLFSYLLDLNTAL